MNRDIQTQTFTDNFDSTDLDTDEVLNATIDCVHVLKYQASQMAAVLLRERGYFHGYIEANVDTKDGSNIVNVEVILYNLGLPDRSDET